MGGRSMLNLELIQATQTAFLVVVALAVIYAVNLLRTELKRAAELVRDAVKNQTELDQNVRRMWERVDALEARYGIHGDVEAYLRIRKLLDAFDDAVDQERPTPPQSPPR
jgi:hypothetical protein